jgi:hypothetical protein
MLWQLVGSGKQGAMLEVMEPIVTVPPVSSWCAGFRRLTFSCFGDARGTLMPVEAQRDVPFAIERVYIIDNVAPDLPRGHHAHYTLRQVLLPLRGAFEMVMDDGQRQWVEPLTSPREGLLLEGLIWHEMRAFSPDCLIMALASAPYDEADYIRDYSVFQQVVGQFHQPKEAT